MKKSHTVTKMGKKNTEKKTWVAGGVGATRGKSDLNYGTGRQ